MSRINNISQINKMNCRRFLRSLIIPLLLPLFTCVVLGMMGCRSDTNSDSDGSSQLPPPQEIKDISNLVIRNFLWKPRSERDGKLTVLVNPTNVRIEVTGAISETLINSGPSNGRGTTGRSTVNQGCNYGANISVEFFDSVGRRILVADGRTSVTIPNGCNRLEFVL